jgi:hypothetical protein
VLDINYKQPLGDIKQWRHPLVGGWNGNPHVLKIMQEACLNVVAW